MVRQIKTPGGTVLFATDFLKPAQRAFSYARTLARALQLRLVILHAIKGVTDARSLLPPDSRYIKPLKTAALLDRVPFARSCCRWCWARIAFSISYRESNCQELADRRLMKSASVTDIGM